MVSVQVVANLYNGHTARVGNGYAFWDANKGGIILDIHDLHCFRLAYENRSIGKAAEQAFLTRQALSHVIRNLETKIGQPLFARDAQGLKPTELAILAYPEVVRLLNDYGTVRETLSGKTVREFVM